MRLDYLALTAIGALVTTSFLGDAAAQDRKQDSRADRKPARSPAPSVSTEAETEIAPQEEERGAGEEAPEEVEVGAEHEATEAAKAAPAEEVVSSPKDPSDPSRDEPSSEVGESPEPVVKDRLAVGVGVGSQCEAVDVRRVARDLTDALADVEAPGARGLGFVFHSRRHVLTTASLIDTGRGIRVRFGDRTIAATVVAVDEAHDLAMLELASPAPAAPLQQSASKARPGDAVLTLRRSRDYAARYRVKRNRQYVRARRGHRRAEADALVHAGTVTFARADRLRTSALSGDHAHWGAPILNCDGEVVGVATSPISDEGAGLSPIESLRSDVSDDTMYRGKWSLFHPSIALLGQMDHTPSDGFGKRDKWLGFSVGTALIGRDRWFVPARFTASFLMAPDLEEPFSERRGYRVQGSTGLGYRIMIKGGATPLYFVPVIGGTVMYQRVRTQRTEFVVEEACPDGGCLAIPRVLTDDVDQLRVMPTFGGGIQLGFGEASYQFMLDTENTERSVHQLTLGVQF